MRQAVALLAVLAASLPTVAEAQTREQCRSMARNASAVLGPAIVNLRRVENMGQPVSRLKAASSGELRSALEDFDDARRKLAAAWRDFIRASRDLRDRSEACSPSPPRRGGDGDTR